MFASYAQHHDAIQAFHKWRQSEAQTSGLRGPNLDTASFIPQIKLEAYLDTYLYLENLLSAVLDSSDRPAVAAGYVREHYLRSFATLLCIGEGRLIYHFQQYRSLRDDKMPFYTKPEDFPHTDDPAVFQNYQDAQWQFCAISLQYDMKDRLRDRDTLPITSKEKVGEGGSAVVHRIVVEESYNALRPPFQPTENRPSNMLRPGTSRFSKMDQQPRQNTFVLKTYRGKEAETNHKKEREAYMKLRGGGCPPPNIVAFYGWFIQGTSYNLILEYADQGTLEDYMERTAKPESIEDVLLFWDRLTQIILGVQSIHGRIGNDTSASQILNGYVVLMLYDAFR